jgi:hypothetical protein
LKLYNVLDEVLDTFYLVIFQSIVDCVCVVEIIAFVFCNFDLVYNWELLVEQMLIFLSEQDLNRFTVKG